MPMAMEREVQSTVDVDVDVDLLQQPWIHCGFVDVDLLFVRHATKFPDASPRLLTIGSFVPIGLW